MNRRTIVLSGFTLIITLFINDITPRQSLFWQETIRVSLSAASSSWLHQQGAPWRNRVIWNVRRIFHWKWTEADKATEPQLSICPLSAHERNRGHIRGCGASLHPLHPLHPPTLHTNRQVDRVRLFFSSYKCFFFTGSYQIVCVCLCTRASLCERRWWCNLRSWYVYVLIFCCMLIGCYAFTEAFKYCAAVICSL